MSEKEMLRTWIVEALERAGGEAPLLAVAKDIWEHHEDDLRHAGNLFYTWQYDMRWAAQTMRDDGILRPADGRRGRWALA